MGGLEVAEDVAVAVDIVDAENAGLACRQDARDEGLTFYSNLLF